jgi:hypothetical protein
MFGMKTFMGYRAACTSIILVVIAALVYTLANAAPVAVRFPEGVTHGYRIVHSQAWETIGQGELTQIVKEGELVESRLVIRFKDGSLYDEKVPRLYPLPEYAVGGGSGGPALQLQ